MPSSPSRVQVAITLGMVVCGALAACSDSGAPTGKGDRLIVDVEASTGEQLPQPSSTPSDSGIGVYIDANAIPSACTTCSCDTSTTFCFGGGGGAAAFSGTCTVTGALAVGCNPLPAACANEPSCPCILQALAGKLPCTYPTCSDSNLSIVCR